MSDPNAQRTIARKLEQSQVVERPGGVSGFDTFFASGTFVPVFAGTGTAGVWTYSVQLGFYTRIGNRVFFTLNIVAATRPTPPTGNATITGLPFTSNTTTNNNHPCSLEVSGLTLSATNTMLTARVAANQTRVDLTELLGTAPATAGFLLATGITATAQVEVSGQYMV